MNITDIIYYIEYYIECVTPPEKINRDLVIDISQETDASIFRVCAVCKMEAPSSLKHK
jgi:hypothetical protein